MEAQKLTHKKGIKLLKEGNTLTAIKSNLDTLSLEKDGSYRWSGIKDKAPTYLKEKEIKSLFKTKKWVLNIR